MSIYKQGSFWKLNGLSKVIGLLTALWEVLQGWGNNCSPACQIQRKNDPGIYCPVCVIFVSSKRRIYGLNKHVSGRRWQLYAFSSSGGMVNVSHQKIFIFYRTIKLVNESKKGGIMDLDFNKHMNQYLMRSCLKKCNCAAVSKDMQRIREEKQQGSLVTMVGGLTRTG